MQNLRIGFTGYRPEKLWGNNLHDAHYQHLSNQLLATIKQLINRYHAQKITANCGLARGADMVFAYTILRLNPLEADLIAWCPFHQQANNWPADQQARYLDLLNACQTVNYSAAQYTSASYHQRNRAIVDHSDLLIAVYNGQPGGTRNTVTYAKRHGCPVILIDPATIT